MPPRSPEPLRKVTLNLFDEDCEWMERRYGHGWSERVRDLVRKHKKRRMEGAVLGLEVDEIEQIFNQEMEEDHG